MGLGDFLTSFIQSQPLLTTGLNIADFFRADQIAQERADERQRGFGLIEDFRQTASGALPQLGFEGQNFGAGGSGSFRSPGIVGPDNTTGFGSFTGTPFNQGGQPDQFSGPDIFNVDSLEDLEQETLGNFGLAGVSPEDRFGTLSDSLLDPFAFDDQESGIRADSQAGFDRGDFTRQQGLDSINDTADRDVEDLRANLRGDFQGVEGLDLPDADEIFRRTQAQTSSDALGRERSAIQQGQGRAADLGRLGFDAFDGSSIFGVQRSALDQRLADTAQGNRDAEAARTGTRTSNSAARGGIFAENQASNRATNTSIGNIFDTRNRSVGTLEDTFLGLDAGRTSDLSASLDALNERRTTTRQGIDSGVFQFLANLPQNLLAQQGGQLENQGAGLQNVLSSLGPEFDALMAELGLIGDREDFFPTLGSIPDALLGFGNDQEFADQPVFNFAGSQ